MILLKKSRSLLALGCLASILLGGCIIADPPGANGGTGEPAGPEVGFPYITQLSPTTRLQGAAASPSEGVLALLLQEGADAYLHTIDMDSGALLAEESGKSLFPSTSSRFDKILFKGNTGVKLITRSGTYICDDLPVWVADGSRVIKDLEVVKNGYAILALDSDLQRQVTAVIDGSEAWTHFVREPLDGGWIFEAHGGSETVQTIFDNYLAVYGPGFAGLTVLDAQTGAVAWEYHLPREDYVITIAESASGLWVSGIIDSHESVVALIDRDGKVKNRITVAGIAARIAAIGPASEDKCWFMAGPVGLGGLNQVYLWDGQSEPVLVLEEVDFRLTLFSEGEREQAVFFLPRHDHYYVLTSDGASRRGDMPISSIERDTAELLHIEPERMLVATRERKSAGDRLQIRNILLREDN